MNTPGENIYDASIILSDPKRGDVLIFEKPDGKQVAVEVVTVDNSEVVFKQGEFESYVEITGIHMYSMPETKMALADFSRAFEGMMYTSSNR